MAHERSTTIDVDKGLGDASPVVQNPIARDQKPVLSGLPQHSHSPPCISVCIPICITKSGKIRAIGGDFLYFMWIFRYLNESAPMEIGAGGGTRTHTTLPSRDFKSLASTSSATSALLISIAFSSQAGKCFPIEPLRFPFR